MSIFSKAKEIIDHNVNVFGSFNESECPVCKDLIVISFLKDILICYECHSMFDMKSGKMEWSTEICLLGIKEKGYLIVYHRDNWEELYCK